MVNKGIFLSLLVIGVVAAAAGAGTWAAFSDTETSSANTLTAGTMDLKLDGADGISSFDIVNVVPNTATTEADSISVTNAGNVDGVLTASLINVVDTEDGQSSDAETVFDGAGELSGEVTIYVSNGVVTYSGLLSDLTTLTDMNFGTIGAGQTITVSYSVGDAGNEIQGDSVSFDIEFSLDQE